MDRLSFFKELTLHPSFRSAVLCTILAEEGSTPRKRGTHMAVLPDGTSIGTVGGGGVERIARADALALSGQPRGSFFLRDYDLDGTTRDTATGMICGGAVRLFFYTPDEKACAVLEEAAKLPEGAQNRYLTISIPVEDPASHAPDDMTHAPVPEAHADGSEAVRLSLLDEKTLHARTGLCALRRPLFRDQLLIEPLTLRGMVYLFGLGHVGRALYSVLRSVHFPVVVIDDRREALDEVLFADAAARLCLPYGMPSDALRITEDDYVVITTAGHRGDFEVLSLVLPLHPAYIGCIGSKRKAHAVSQRLLDAGFAKEEVEAIHSPVGLAIGAETPAEIAVSIAAEMIRHRAARLKGDAS